MAINMPSMSLYLREHPILQDRNTNKFEEYIDFLSFYSNGNNDRFSTSLLELYKKEIAGLDYIPNPNPKIDGLVKYSLFLYMDLCLINAFNKPEKGKILLQEIEAKSGIAPSYWKKMRQLYTRLFDNDKKVVIPKMEHFLRCWDHNKSFLQKHPYKIVFTANMSSGKSTLINALVGKKINKSQSMACTAKLHYIYNKPFEDGYSAEDDNILNLDADYNTLMTDDEANNSTDIIVSTFFRSTMIIDSPICFLDTPGVNFSLDQTHKAITDNEILKGDFDQLVYVINADGNIATDDEHDYMKQLAERFRSVPIVFVVNKLDRFQRGEDSISESLSKIESDIKRIGFSNAIVCPASAYAGFLAKMSIYEKNLNEDEQDDLDAMRRLFNRKEYMLSLYYPDYIVEACENTIDAFKDKTQKRLYQLLLDCGIMPLEHLLLKKERSNRHV